MINVRSFCEECPLKGRCSSEVVGIRTHSLRGERFGTGAFITTLAAVIDNKKRPSEPLQVPASITPDEIVDAIENCEYPQYVERGILWWKKTVPICRAIGNFACTDPQIYPIAKQVL